MNVKAPDSLGQGGAGFRGNERLPFGMILGAVTFWPFAQSTLNTGVFIVVMSGLAARLGRLRILRRGFVFGIARRRQALDRTADPSTCCWRSPRSCRRSRRASGISESRSAAGARCQRPRRRSAILLAADGTTKNRLAAGFMQQLDLIGRGDRIRTCDLYVPNVALYQTELHPDS